MSFLRLLDYRVLDCLKQIRTAGKEREKACSLIVPTADESVDEQQNFHFLLLCVNRVSPSVCFNARTCVDANKTVTSNLPVQSHRIRVVNSALCRSVDTG